MALLTQIDVSSLFLHDCTINAKGTRSCAISFKDTTPVQIKLGEQPLRTPFGFSSYDENANRKNLDLSISDASLAGAIREIDQWVLNCVIQDPQKYLGKSCSAQLCEEMFKKSLTESKERQYPPTLRSKVTVGEGPYQLRCWNENKERRPLPEDARVCLLQPLLIIKSVWFMGSAFGVLWECPDLLIFEQSQECPL
jgi:hypothetical protein